MAVLGSAAKPSGISSPSFIHEFDEDGIRKTDYEETQAYQVTNRFMRDPRATVEKLLADDEGEIDE